MMNDITITYSSRSDDLSQIHGIGPAVAKRLQNAKIDRYEQLASMKPEEIAEIIQDMIGFSLERITEQDWIGQAGKLADQVASIQDEPEAIPNNHRQHYALFTVKFLLEKNNQVRRTQVENIQTSKKATWAGWDDDLLRRFFIENGSINLLTIEKPGFEANKTFDSSPHSIKENIRPQEQNIYGLPEIIDFQLAASGDNKIKNLYQANNPFIVNILLDMKNVEVPPLETLDYEASLFAEISKERRLVGKEVGTISTKNTCEIQIPCNPLPPGFYDLEALIALSLASQPKRLQHQLYAITEGLKVYFY